MIDIFQINSEVFSHLTPYRMKILMSFLEGRKTCKDIHQQAEIPYSTISKAFDKCLLKYGLIEKDVLNIYKHTEQGFFLSLLIADIPRKERVEKFADFLRKEYNFNEEEITEIVDACKGISEFIEW